ncbi:flagellar rod assembly protein/muramidase FlgJ [Sulfuriferula plumbiphila]|uniref:Peptidoglycan hydrolase FlgJ n=1 Tax=Sulfuriferula plumbiphila TaxID=171865 RepID=A0A512L5B6_9PROT|nr:flagellar assembly peptidoglycan hydrolase FlgJ [Sulfuriferula plumbiphila]BBP03830.1 flagellar rod assembly protein/muramidase FlgJ [Sulfuriferula plumbiphila]GEP29341.1 flagellar rod assembly protein/muramidase FlgJ [Sulfuriferula plumbiphila]
MINPSELSAKLALDTQSVEALRQSARQNSPEGLKTVARQFEALFMNMMLKSMREASPQDGAFDNEQSRMYTSMLDQQLSQNLAARGVGLADVLIRQLSSSVTAPAPGKQAGPAIPALIPPAPGTGAGKTDALQPAHVQAFQTRLGPHAEEASRTTGIPAKFMLGQAALESGWGRREIVAADGTPSHNLFGIKAGGGWDGKVVEHITTEYVHGVAQKKVQKFRAYDNYADAFRDYAHLLRSNPRYQQVLANAQDVTGFAQGLQRAGYATDPHYADKLTRIITQSLSA